MEVNATLLVQLANFFVTYAFLRRFFFREALESLRTRKERIELAQDMVKQKKENLLAEQKHIHAILTNFQNQFFTHYKLPVLQLPTTLVHISYRPDTAEIAKLVKKTTNFLVTQVPHVD